MIPNTATSIQYAGNGSATVFSFPNKIFAATDLTVSLIQTATGAITAFVLNTDYTVQNVDVDTGAQVTTTVAPSSGYTLDIRTTTSLVQATSIKNQGSFLPELHEEAFDRLTREVQDLKRLTYSFGLHGPDNEPNPWPALPAANIRASSSLIFDVTGMPSVGVAIPGAPTQPVFVDVGTANALIVTVAGSLNFAYINGAWFDILIANTTSSTVTINLNGLGVRGVLTSAGTNLDANTFLSAGSIYRFVYDGANFRVSALIPGAATFATGTFTAVWDVSGITLGNTTMTWKRNGSLVTLFLPAQTGPSAGTGFGFSGLPSALQPSASAFQQMALVASMVDNGVNLATPSVMRVTNSGSVSFWKDGSGAFNWTGSGQKGFFQSTSATYCLN